MNINYSTAIYKFESFIITVNAFHIAFHITHLLRERKGSSIKMSKALRIKSIKNVKT